MPNSSILLHSLGRENYFSPLKCSQTPALELVRNKTRAVLNRMAQTAAEGQLRGRSARAGITGDNFTDSVGSELGLEEQVGFERVKRAHWVRWDVFRDLEDESAQRGGTDGEKLAGLGGARCS